MDVLILLDKLDDLIYTAKQIPLTDQVRVERQEAYSLLDQIRVTLPEEIKQAREIVKEGPSATASEAESDDDHLQEIQTSIEELKRSQRPAPPPLTAVAAEKVRAIVEAAEASAEEVRAEAERDARRIRSEAARRGMEMRKRSAGEAATRLRRADEVTASLLAEAASASADIDGLLDKIRGPAGVLAGVLGEGAERVEADLDRMRALVTEAPLSEDWDEVADPEGEILARREVAPKAEDERPADDAVEGADRVDHGSQDTDHGSQDMDHDSLRTEEWSVEEAVNDDDEAETEAVPPPSPFPVPHQNSAG